MVTVIMLPALTPVVQKLDNAIRWMNLYPVDKAIGFPNAYPRDSEQWTALHSDLTTGAWTLTQTAG